MSVSSMDSVIGHELFVGGLAGTTDDQDLLEAFSEFGEIVAWKIIKNRETGRSRGFGFVKFKDEQAMRDAIEGMHGQDLDGRNITVSEAKTRGSGGVGFRSHGGGGGRDGGGYNRGGGRYRGGGGRDGGGYRRGGSGGGYGGGRDRGYSEGSGGHYSRGGGSEGSWARITIYGRFSV